jgi:hypothetical protein
MSDEITALKIQCTANMLDCLRHMLGADNKKNRGYRNHFCANINEADGDYAAMTKLETLGLVRAGRTLNEGRDQYFYATELGCKVLGFNKKETAQAME